jgi:hypothetical protein
VEQALAINADPNLSCCPAMVAAIARGLIAEYSCIRGCNTLLLFKRGPILLSVAIDLNLGALRFCPFCGVGI